MSHWNASSVPSTEIRTQLEKILAHKLFARSERMIRFLRFVIEESLQGRGAELKEYLIGIEVFDRKPDYDPRIDPIVRVEARRLRGKLQAYYETDGNTDPVLIEFAAGSYAPRIRYRTEPVAVVMPQPRTVAVLPFTNLAPSDQSNYFSDGLTEELIHTLTKLSEVRVVAWSSAARMRGTEQDLAAIRQQLHASHVLTGSIRISDAGLRVRAQLIDAQTGVYLWSETIDREMREVLAIQEGIAKAIARTLQLQLSSAQGPLILTRGNTSLTSYDYYLKGRYHWHRRTPEDLARSARYFEAAIEADPHSALAHSGLADAFTLLVDYGVMPSTEGIPRAKAAAMRAIQLDETLADAYPALALIRSHYDAEWNDAEALYRKALSLNPGCATAHHRLAIVHHALLGRFSEAADRLENAINLDPLSSILYEGRAVLHLLQRRYEEAIQKYRAILEFDATYARAYTGMGRAYALMGQYESALEMLEKGRQLGGDAPYTLSALSQVYALSGDPPKARAMLHNLHDRAKQGYVPSTCFAIAHLGLGEKDDALAWLEKGCQQREMRLAILKVHPVYDGLRGSPRFDAMLERLGLRVSI